MLRNVWQISMKMTQIKADLDVPVEVTEAQYEVMIIIFAGIVAHRSEGGRFWIKRLVGFKKEVEYFLNQT